MYRRTFSVSVCRTTRARVAPIAIRTASSRRRPNTRSSCRFATLAHAISSTRPTAPSSASSGVRTSSKVCSWIGVSASFAPSMPFAAGIRSIPADTRRLRRGAIEAGAGSEADECDHAQRRRKPGQPAAGRRAIGQRRTERQPAVVVVARIGTAETARHDADDRRRHAVDAETAAEDVRRPAELAHPEVVTENHHAGRAGPVVVIVEHASQQGRRSEHAEHAGRDAFVVEPAHVAKPGEHRPRAAANRRDRFEGSGRAGEARYAGLRSPRSRRGREP